jgi:hypothetical protein
MDDLELWSCLRGGTLGRGLAEPLCQLARLPLHRRAAFLGLLEPALRHADPKVRAAAVLCLEGATGIGAWKKLVAALKDPEPAVRRAAVDALHASAKADPVRWVHALFHPDAVVVERALQLGPPEGFFLPFDFPVGPSGARDLAAAALPAGLREMDELAARVEEILRDRLSGWEDIQALEDFLRLGTEVDTDLRSRAGFYLAHITSQELALPVMVHADHFESDPAVRNAARDLLLDVPGDVVETLARAAVTQGCRVRENWLSDLMNSRSRFSEDEAALALLVAEATDPEVRRWARDYLPYSATRDLKLARLARVFAWGMVLGRYLTGHLFRIEMIPGEMEMGYTRLKENKIYITPRPILLGERFGTEVVRGLILHEYGHHLYHKGPEAEEVWHQAELEKLDRLLNLVEDEHLERNLRHRSSLFGHLLKILAAYAFQHSQHEVPVAALLGVLGERAPAVLRRAGLGAARKPGHVAVGSGRLLREMEDAGSSFARFLRGLRLGLGNRSGDPRVAQGLALFRGRFRHSTMPQLLAIARKLREIFGQEADLLEHLSMEKALAIQDDEWLGQGEGLLAADVCQAAEGLLEARQQKRRGTRPGGTGLNLGPEEHFNRIDNIQPVPHDPARHADYARRVARAARRLREYFRDLGLGLRPERRRLQGRLIDRTRLRDLLLKGDPRLLIAHQQERLTDLFLGVLIDCSGSMAGPKMEKARLFGTLLAEAVKDHAGIDLRLFGFEDRVIWDAGTARRCAAHALNAGGGNNDAAALWHASQVARVSHRKARLLVMISDGLPAECTVAALRALVSRLTRQNYCCAQVAVQALSEICFPHYVVVEDENFDAAVQKFGNIVMRLVGKALGA